MTSHHPSPALAVTGADLIGALVGIARAGAAKPSALDRAIAQMPAAVADARTDIHAANVRVMLKQRWRITRAVYPLQTNVANVAILVSYVWPPEAGPVQALTDCRQAIRVELARLDGTSGSGFVPGCAMRLRTLREAEDALIQIIAEDARQDVRR